MSRKLTNSGLAVTGIGAVAAVIGLILFISVFFAVGRQINSPFGPGFGHHQPFPFSRAVIGVVMFGIGGLLVKAGLSMTVVGSSDKIGAWLSRVIHGETPPTAASRTCPNCRSSAAADDRFCSKCGSRLE
jgi:hypothetical protein